MVANRTHDQQNPLANALSIWLLIPDASADRRRRRPPKPAFLRCAFEAVARFLADPRSVAATTPCQN
jgi:hypothetical protein